MKLRYLIRHFLSLFIVVGLLGNFSHCVEAFVVNHVDTQKEITSNHHTTDTQSECHNEKDLFLSFFSQNHSSQLILGKVLPESLNFLVYKTIPKPLKRVVYTAPPNNLRPHYLSLNSIRLLL